MKIEPGKKYLVVMDGLKTEAFAVRRHANYDMYKMQSAFGEPWVHKDFITEIEEE